MSFYYWASTSSRAAAFDERVRAVVLVSSWYTPAGLYARAPALTQASVRQYFGENAPEVQAATLAGAAGRIKVPLLQVYGGRDKASPPEHAYRIEKEVRGPTTTVVFEEGVHVCNNVQYKARPLIADWLADNL